jgi:lipopolysaccharide assembly protein A
VHFKLILSLILAGLAVLFVVQNVAVVEVRFLFWGLHMTLSLLIFLLFAGGLIVGWLLHSYWAYRRRGLEPQIQERGSGTAEGHDGTKN